MDLNSYGPSELQDFMWYHFVSKFTKYTIKEMYGFPASENAQRRDNPCVIRQERDREPCKLNYITSLDP